jgi:hypothetical protein
MPICPRVKQGLVSRVCGIQTRELTQRTMYAPPLDPSPSGAPT